MSEERETVKARWLISQIVYGDEGPKLYPWMRLVEEKKARDLAARCLTDGRDFLVSQVP